MGINMRSCISVLVLFILLIDKSDSAISLSSAKNLYNKFIANRWDKIIKDFPTDDVIEKIEENLPPPSPNIEFPLKGPKGLNVVKRYLAEFGYLNSSEPYDDYFYRDTVSAIKACQQFYNWPVTGFPNREMLNLILLPRCGSPDVNFDYDFNGTDVSWPKAGTRWFPKGTRNLTYFIGSEIPRNTTNVFRSAFARWAEATTVLNFTETKHQDDADIRVGSYIFNSSLVWDLTVGGAFIQLEKDSNVKTGEVYLDGTMDWVPPAKNGTQLSWKEGVLDLETVVMHQIGHLLGLDHSSNQDSVMYPAILPSRQRKVQLSEDDKEAILKFYTTTTDNTITNNITNFGHGGRFTLFRSSWGLLTTLSLGFVCMILLY